MRLLVLAGLIYLLYRALKRWMVSTQLSAREGAFPKRAGEIDDLMVKDPYCETYFPKKDGYHLKADGKDLYFCSTECRDNYVKKHTDDDS